MIKYLLDTNIVIYVIKRKPIEALSKFNAHAEQMAVSTITTGELYYGVENSAQQQTNRLIVEDFLSRLPVITYDQQASAHYGDIKADLKRKGTPIGENDIHIAGHARSKGLVLVTNNVKEFTRVDGLRLENWL